MYKDGKNVGAMRVNESLTSLSAMAFGSLKVEKLSVRAKAMYGQNTSHMQQPTGFGIVAMANNGTYTYEAMQLGSAWITMMYGKKLRYGFFAGWLKNFGSVGNAFATNNKMVTVNGKEPNYAFVVRNNSQVVKNEEDDSYEGLDQAFRFSPIVTYKVQNLTIGLEYEHTAAAYGTYRSNGTVTDTHWVANHRACMMLKYDF